MTAATSIEFDKARSIASLPGPRGLPLLGSVNEFKADRAHLILEDWARKCRAVYKVRLGLKTLIIRSDHDAAMKALRELPEAFTRSRVVRPIFAE